MRKTTEQALFSLSEITTETRSGSRIGLGKLYRYPCLPLPIPAASRSARYSFATACADSIVENRHSHTSIRIVTVPHPPFYAGLITSVCKAPELHSQGTSIQFREENYPQVLKNAPTEGCTSCCCQSCHSGPRVTILRQLPDLAIDPMLNISRNYSGRPTSNIIIGKGGSLRLAHCRHGL